MNGTSAISRRKKPLWPRIRNYAGFYVFAAIVLAFVVIFHYLPMTGIRYAFTKYTIIKAPIWKGLDNFKRLFAMPNFWQAFTNTIELSVLKLLLTTGFSVILSLLLNEMNNIWGKKITKATLYNFQMKLRSMMMGSNLPTAIGSATENTVQNAAVIVAILPFMILYPFPQKYFVKGINIGAVKE